MGADKGASSPEARHGTADADDGGPRAEKGPTGPMSIFLCAAFVFGLFVASFTFNFAMYMSLRHGPTTEPAGRVHHHPGLWSAYRATVYNNIARLEVQFGTFDAQMPWQTVPATFQGSLPYASAAMASGLILEQGLILTAGYVATDATLITATRQGDSRRFVANIVALAPDLDLALLNVSDPAFQRPDDVVVKLVDEDARRKLPAIGTKVVVAGFPLGAEMSISQLPGRVSRITAGTAGPPSRYGAFPRPLLGLYPKIGNRMSVGPVFDADTNGLVGFLGLNEMITPVGIVATFVQTFLKEGRWRGLGMLGLVLRPMQAPSLRRYWDLPPDDVGVQVRSVCPDSPLAKHIRKGDMLMALDGNPVHSNGAVVYRRSMGPLTALPFQVLLGEKAVGDKARFTIRRTLPKEEDDQDGHAGYAHAVTFDINATLGPLPTLVPRLIDTKGMHQPTFFMVGGLVWAVFTEALLRQSQMLGGVFVPAATQVTAMRRWRQNPREEVVVLLRGMEHKCNEFYEKRIVRVLRYFNDENVLNMQQFVESVGSALKNETSFLKFAFAPLDDDDLAGGVGDPDIVLDTELCRGADSDVMIQHGIPFPASADLRTTYEQSIPIGFVGRSADLNSGKATKVLESPSKRTNKYQAEGRDINEARLHQVPWENVVQIRLIAAEQDFISPWKTMMSQESRCSAIIVHVAERRILTNSHCVADAKSLYIMREDAPDPVPATVVEIAHDVDLAWITTDDDGFWSADLKPEVPLHHGLPYLSSVVRVVGYPTGGNSITITQGIVSRIDGQIYPNGLTPGNRNTPNTLLIVQVDAAINPGNSGGPVFDTEGNLVGLAFAGLALAQNVGYVIPNRHLQNFVDAVKDGRWQAQPEIGAIFRAVENPGMRKFLQLEPGETGIQVRSVSSRSPLYGKASRGDVLKKVDGYVVEGTGQVVRNIDGNFVNLPMATLVTEKARTEETSMSFLRVDPEGVRSEFTIKEVFHPIPPLVPRFFDAPKEVTGREHFAAQPSYLLVGGLVWGVLSNPVLQQAMARRIMVPWSVVRQAYHRWLGDDDEEVVVLLQGLGHPCNMYYDTSTMRILDSFNGRPVKNMAQFAEMVVQAELQGEEYMRFTFTPLADEDTAGSASDPDVILYRRLCADADANLLEVHNIRSRFSVDLLPAVERATNVSRSGEPMRPSALLAARTSAREEESAITADARLALRRHLGPAPVQRSIAPHQPRTEVTTAVGNASRVATPTFLGVVPKLWGQRGASALERVTDSGSHEEGEGLRRLEGSFSSQQQLLNGIQEDPVDVQIAAKVAGSK